jgi:hypothetical protein
VAFEANVRPYALHRNMRRNCNERCRMYPQKSAEWATIPLPLSK